MYDTEEYEFVKEIFEEEFPEKYQQLLDAGIILFEIINVLEACRQLFDLFPVSVNEDNRQLQYAVIGTIADSE